MSYIDVLIPGIIGLLAAVKPDLVFLGSKVAPTQKKLTLIRRLGVVLLVVAMAYFFIIIARA